LLGEISESSRRIHVAKGGHFTKASARGSAPPEEHVQSDAPDSGNVLPPLNANEQPLNTSTADEAAPEEDVFVSDVPAESSEHVDESTPPMPDEQDSSEGEPAAPQEAVVSDTQLQDAASGASPEHRDHRLEMPTDDVETLKWRSYCIDEQKVSDAVLGAIWRRAVDPKHCIEEVVALARVPRMTVTRREVEQLPAVHDIQHWRAVKTKRREARKADEESETFPPLGEMMRTIFGEDTPPRKRVQGLYAQMHELQVAEKRRSSFRDSGKGASAADVPDEGELEHNFGTKSEASATMEIEEDEALQKDVNFDVPKKAFLGVRRKGRRDAFDEGQPWQRGNQPLAEIQEKVEESRRLRNSGVSHVLEDSQKAQFDDEHVKKLAIAHHKVNERCQRKVARMHSQFVRKQAQLSARLTRRVQRLQMDFEETQDTKVTSILPSVIATSKAAKRGSAPAAANANSDRAETVLQYLQHHRHRAEQQRQSHHASYLQQVERFQGYLKLLADPNRNPDRGELYLSECFRHVLAAGLVMDNAFFIRVLHNLEAEDFDKTATVNLLAACCVSFNIDLRQYWAHLNQRGLSCLTPRPQRNEARSWEDWAPWNGVKLEQLLPLPRASTPGNVDPLEEETAEIERLMEDPCPFMPIVPEESPSASNMSSRNDGDQKKFLQNFLQKLALDSVLQRYQIRRDQSVPNDSSRKDIEDGSAEEFPTKVESTPPGSSSSSLEASAIWRGQPKTPQTPPREKAEKTSTPPQVPLPPSGARAGAARPGQRKQLNTLQRTRGMAEPMAEMPGAPDKDRPRAVAQHPSMASISEKPFLE
jgi:hypothetical protein